MSKITLNNVADLTATTTAAAVINANSAKITAAFDNTLSRDGTVPNTLSSNIDMNSNQIVNLPNPATATSPLRLSDLNTFIGGGTITNIPSGGTTGQVLGKTSNSNFQVNWLNSVTSVGLALPADLTVTGSPVTTTGTLTAAWANTPTGTGGVVRTANPALTSPTLTTPVINGLSSGTGVATISTPNTIALRDANGNVQVNSTLPGFNTTTTVASTTTLTAASPYNQYFTGTTTQTLVLPLASTMVQGQSFRVTNLSTGAVTIQSSGFNAITVVPGNGCAAIVSCILISGTTAASWNVVTDYEITASGKVLNVSNSLTLAGTDGTTQTFPSTSATIARTDSAQTFTGIQTLTNPNIIGTATNDNAATGSVGEYVSSTVLAGAPVALTTATPVNVTSISLTAGDWDVAGVVCVTPANTTQMTQLVGSISTTTGTLNTTPGNLVALTTPATTYDGATQANCPMSPVRISISSTTTVFLVAMSKFTVSTNAAFGIIRARRAR